MDASEASATATPLPPTLDRLHGWMAADRALALMTRGLVRANGLTLAPSGADALACMLARVLLGHRGDAALALPRGLTPLPAVVGAYVAMQRHAHPHLHGSVLVASARGDLARELRDLTVDGAPFASLRVGRLVSRPKTETAGVRLDGSIRPPDRQAMLRPLRGGPLVGLSEKDGHVLFARPSLIPAPPAKGVISYAVVETAGSSRPQPGHGDDLDSPDAWSSAHRTLRAAGARTLWLGELGDETFETFCTARSIPLIRAGWPLLARLSELEQFRHAGAISAAALTRRAAQRPPIAYRIVHDREREELARDCYTLLGKMRRQGRSGPLPAPVKSAYELLSVTTRLAVPLDDYEHAAAVGSPMFNRSARALIADIRRADASQFTGRWKEAYRRHWDALAGSLRALARLAEGEPAKLHAAFDELAAALRDGRELVICTQTETERRALIKLLADLEVNGVTVATFARRVDAGGGSARRRVVLLGAPPPWQAPLLLSAEKGDCVVLCYAHEEPRLRAAVSHAERAYGDDSANIAALDALGIAAAQSADGWHPEPAEPLVALTPFGEPAEDEPGWDDADLPAADSPQAWRELVELWGTDIEPGLPVDEHTADTYNGVARIVQFVGAPPVALRDDRAVDVLDGDSIITKAPGDLLAGEHIAFVPGVEHNSLRDMLMAAWDDTRQTERTMCEPLWRNAIDQAAQRLGVPALAQLCDRHESTVRTWLDGRATPQQSELFEAVLRACANDTVWQARAPIWAYLTKKRGTHRLIGRRLRDAISEALSDDAEQPNVRALEELTLAPVGDLLAVVEELVVAGVSPPVPAALADCGHYLPSHHPLLQGARREP